MIDLFRYRKEDIQERNFNLDAKSEFKEFWTNGNDIKAMESQKRCYMQLRHIKVKRTIEKNLEYYVH